MGNRDIPRSIAHIFYCLVLIISVIAGGCGTKEEKIETVPTRDINSVMEDHTQKLMEIAGVVGVAVSENENKMPCIMVLVVKETKEILDQLPKEIEGYPVCPFESGEIKPLSDS